MTLSFFDDMIDLRDFPDFVNETIDSFESDEPGTAEFEAEYAASPELNAVLDLAVELLYSGNFGGNVQEAAAALSAHGDSYDPTLIDALYFKDYARQLAEDLGCIPDDYSWPASHIDWDAAADSLKMDYMSVSLAGREFFIRG